MFYPCERKAASKATSILRLSSLALLATLASVSSAQYTVNRKRDASFKLPVPSVWKNGTGIDKQITIGPQWSKKDSVGFSYEIKTPEIDLGFYTIPSFSLGETGVTLGYDVAAGFGFNAGVKYVGGAADVTSDGDVQFTFDRDPQPGKACKVVVSYVPRSTSRFLTTSPRLSTTLETIFGFEASINASATFLDAPIIPKGTALLDYKQPNLGFAGHYLIDGGKLEDLNDLEAIKLINQQTPIGMTFQSPDGSTAGKLLKEGGVYTSTMTSDGLSPFVTVETTLAQLILAFASGGAAEKLAFVLDGSVGLDPTGKLTDLKASWDFAKVSGRVGLGLRHQYTFQPNLKVNVEIKTTEDGRTLLSNTDVPIGSTITFTMPEKGGVVLSGEFSATPTFRSKVSSGVRGGLNITPLELQLKGKLGVGDFAKDIDWDFNPYSYDWTSKDASLFTISDETQDFTVGARAFDTLLINPTVANFPTPHVYGDANGTQEYLDMLPYGGYTYGADAPNPARVSIMSEPTFGFSGLNRDRLGITFTPETWDNRFVDASLAPVDGLVESPIRMSEGNQSRTSLPVDFHWALLRPGLHSLRFETTGKFYKDGTPNGLAKVITSHYDVPVIVRLPAINIDSDILTGSDDPIVGTGDKDHRINVLDATYRGQRLYLQTNNALLETEVVLDDGTIVLPTTKIYATKVITTNGDDKNRPAYSDRQEFNWYKSGNHVISFTVPPALAKSLAGTTHTVRLRTKDPFSDGYVLSPLASAKPLHFPVAAPTVSRIAYGPDVTGSKLPILNEAYTVMLTGTNFTPATTASMKLGSKAYPLVVEYVDPTSMKATIPAQALDDQQSSATSGAITVTSAPFTVTNAIGFDPNAPASLTSGGSASKSVSFRMPAPVIVGIQPGSPVRGVAGDFTVSGMYFSKGATPDATTEVFFDGVQLNASQVTFPSEGRGLRSMALHLPATRLQKVGRMVLRVRSNGGESSYDVTVSNAKPALTAQSLYVRIGNGASPRLLVYGGVFYDDTQVFVGGARVAAGAGQPDVLYPTLDPTLNVPATTLSVLNPLPGGGQSGSATLTVLEGDAKTLGVTRGAASFSPLTGLYKQQFTLTYGGNRTMKGTVVVNFTLPAGTSMTDSDRSDGGLPTRRLNVDMLKGGKVTFTATFKNQTKTVPTFTPGVKIVN